MSALLVGPTACGGTQSARFVRDTDAVGLDDPAMSTGLDRKDLDRVFVEQARDLVGSRFYSSQRSGRAERTIAIVPMRNETTEHIDFQLDALSSKLERQLVSEQVMAVVSLENHPEIIEQISAEQSPIFDPRTAARVGRMLGVNYILTGKVYDKAERVSNMRRVQYFLFMQTIEVETGRIVWQGESAVTKALVTTSEW